MTREQQMIEELSERLFTDLIFAGAAAIGQAPSGNDQPAALVDPCIADVRAKMAALEKQIADYVNRGVEKSSNPEDMREYNRDLYSHQIGVLKGRVGDEANNLEHRERELAEQGTFTIREAGVETTARVDPQSGVVHLSACALHDPSVKTGEHTEPPAFRAALRHVCAAAANRPHPAPDINLSPADTALAASLKWSARQDAVAGRVTVLKDTPIATYSALMLKDSKVLFVANLKFGPRMQIRDADPSKLIKHTLAHKQALFPGQKQAQGASRRISMGIKL